MPVAIKLNPVGILGIYPRHEMRYFYKISRRHILNWPKPRNVNKRRKLEKIRTYFDPVVDMRVMRPPNCPIFIKYGGTCDLDSLSRFYLDLHVLGVIRSATRAEIRLVLLPNHAMLPVTVGNALYKIRLATKRLCIQYIVFYYY